MKIFLNNCKKLLLLPLMLIFTLTTFCQQSEFANKVEGIWQGKLETGAIKLTLVLKIKSDTNHALIATMDSPDQGVKDIGITTIRVKDDSLNFTSAPVKGSYSGKWDKQSQKILGEWSQSGMKFVLNLEKTDKISAYNRPQEPKQPYPYKSEEVSFKNQNGGFKLAGTLTLPEGKGPFPACILVSGSGPQNRDEEILGHKPFLLLADYLTKKGFAVLRYDDRGIASSGGNFQTATTLDFATDAKAAFDFLRNDSRISSSKIGFIGHSEGGVIAPIVATQNLATAFIILLAAPSIPGEDILYSQQQLISKASGIDDNKIKEALKINREIFGVLKKVADTTAAALKIASIIEKDAANSDDTKKMDKETLKKYIDSQVKTLNSPWFRTFLTLDPARYLEQVRCPVLAIYGEKDLQVPPSENVKPLKKALAKAGNSDYQVLEMPGLNHLFQASKTGSPDEYSQIEETISPKVLEIIAAWLSLKTK